MDTNNYGWGPLWVRLRINNKGEWGSQYILNILGFIDQWKTNW